MISRVVCVESTAAPIAGHTVRIIKANGTTVERHFTLRDGAVMIDPDIRRHFPDSKKVNAALRSILAH
jgi:hypothetical protein